MRTPSDSDEAMLRDPYHPSHTSGGRELVWTFSFVAIAGTILYFAADLSWIPFIPYFVIVGLIGFGLGLAFMRFVSGTNERHRVRNEAEYREMIEAEKHKEIEQMRSANPGTSSETRPARKGG